jgi:signal transduction histidine kinase
MILLPIYTTFVTREPGLLQSLTATDRLSDLLPLLHHHAVTAVEGRSSILFQFARSGDTLQATSAFGVEHLPPNPWPARMVPSTLFKRDKPLFVADVSRVLRAVPEYLGTLPAVLVPLAHMQNPLGILVIGCEKQPSAEQLLEASAAGHALTLTLDRARATSQADLHAELRELLQAFSRDVSLTTLSAGLEMLCGGANRLFDADRTSVWLHERRAKVIVLAASSDVLYLAEDRRVPTSDARPASAALRNDRAEIAATGVTHGGGHIATVTIPLKGRRRALGTLVMEGVRIDPGSQMDLLDRADEMGRQLAAAIENVLLLDAVLRSRRELQNTFNSLTDLVAVSDQNSRLVYMNDAFLTRVGKERHELSECPMGEVVGAATVKILRNVLAPLSAVPLASRAGQSPTIASAEVEDEKLGGTFLMTMTPLLGEEREPAGVVLVARDVTPQAELEAERAELRNRLVQSEKLAALGQFVAGIAHELNNPLQGVLGHIELLRATGAFPKTLRRDMQRIYREADRAAKIVRNLLVFAGSRRLMRRRTSLNAALSRVLLLRAPAFRDSNIEVVRRHSDLLPRVKADPLLLHQALLNIVLNAEQAIGTGGGRIETTTSVRRSGDTYVFVQIRDTGPGIAAEVMPRLFEPFYTTKEVGKGTGLGLAIAYGIIQEHGGRISATNHPEGGAVFTVQLPAENG